MSDPVLEAAASFVFACDLTEGGVEFLWHAGEPLSAGLPFFRRAFALLAARAPAGVAVRHTVQTNGTLVTPAWCDLFSEYRVSVGLSIDGPPEIHNLSRQTWAGRGTHDKVMSGYRLLRDAGMAPAALCVLTRESLKHPDRIYDFFKDAGFKAVAFNVEESEGLHVRSALQDVDVQEVCALYESFMRRLWRRWRADESRMVIREFQQVVDCVRRLRNDSTFVRDPPEVVPFRIITIRSDGALSTFSPELISTKSTQYEDFVLGNVLTETPTNVAESLAFRRLDNDVTAGRSRCKESCQYYALCGAQFQSNRFAEHESLLATETLTCRLHRQILTDVVVDELITETRALANEHPIS